MARTKKAEKVEATKTDEKAQPDVKNQANSEPVVDSTKETPSIKPLDNAESIKNEKTTLPTSEKKKSLKSKEIESNGMTYKEAKEHMFTGGLAKLPEWSGFWFADIITRSVFVLTKDGKILDTPHDEYKERNDWQVAEPTEEQINILKDFWRSVKPESKPAIEEDVVEQDREYDKKQLDEINSLKAIGYNHGYGTSFRKLDKSISIKKLENRDVPSELSVNAEFLMDNGQVYDYAKNQLTNRFELDILKFIK